MKLIFVSRKAKNRTYKRKLSNNTTYFNVICIKKRNKQKNNQSRLQPCPATAVLRRPRNSCSRQTPPTHGPEMAVDRGHLLRPRAHLASLSTSPAYRARGSRKTPTYLLRDPHPGGRTPVPWWGAVAGSGAHRHRPRLHASPSTRVAARLRTEGPCRGKQAPVSETIWTLLGLGLGWGKVEGPRKWGSLAEDGWINSYFPAFTAPSVRELHELDPEESCGVSGLVHGLELLGFSCTLY